MSPSAFPANPDQGSVADTVARTLLDSSVCPACAAPLSGPRCGRCGVDLSGDAGRRVWSLGHRAVLTLREREQLLAAMQGEAARAAEHASIAAAARGRAARALDERGAPPARPPAPPTTPPASTGSTPPGGRSRGPAVQSLLVGLGALLLAVAAVVFLAVAWDLLGLAGRAAVVAVLTAAALGAAAFLRPRLPETAEALAALGAVLVVGDAFAARATGLGGTDDVPGLLYAAFVAALTAVVLGALGAVARLRAGTVTAALLAPVAPALAGLHAAGADHPVGPVVAGLLLAAVVAAGRGLLPARLRAEVRVARAGALVATALAAFLVATVAPSPEAAWGALAAVPVLALQALADVRWAALAAPASALKAVIDGSRTRGGGARASAAGAPLSPGRGWPALWSFATGAAAVSTPVLAVLAALDGRTGLPGGLQARPAAAAVTAAVAAALVLAAVSAAARTPAGRRLARRGLDGLVLVAGAGAALAVPVLLVAAAALEELVALAQAASPPWRALPGTPVGDLLAGAPVHSAGEQLALVAGLAVPGLLAAAVPFVAGRAEDAAGIGLDPLRRIGEVALAVAAVLLGTLPGLAVATSAALLAAASVAAGALWGRTRRPLLLAVTVATAAGAVVVAWTAQLISAPVTGLGVLGLLAAHRAVARPELRAALSSVAVVAAAVAVAAATAPLLAASAPWPELSPAAAARLLAVLAAAGALAGLPGLVLPAGSARGWSLVERRAAAGAAVAVGVLALPGTLGAGRSTAATVVLAGLLALAAAASFGPGAVVAGPARTAAAAAVPVLAAGVAAAGTDAMGGSLRAVALAAVLVAVAAAAVLVALALRVADWPADPRRLPAELGAAVAAAGGLASAAGAPGAWLPFALTGAGLAALAVTPDRGRLADASVLPFAVASGLLLAEVGVHVPEAYTLPPALALLALGGRRLATGAVSRSWPALGPGLVLALAPSVIVAGDRGPLVRVVVLTLAAAGVVLAGVRGRLAAPVVVGSGALAAHAVAQLGPELIELGTSVPRWTVLAVVGALLLLEGATYERQVSRLRSAAVRLASLR